MKVLVVSELHGLGSTNMLMYYTKEQKVGAARNERKVSPSQQVENR